LNRYIYGDSAISDVEKCYIINAMPNIAAGIRESMTVISKSTPSPPKEFEAIVSWIFNAIGRTIFIPEDLFGAGSILAGATPAMFAIAFDGILDGAVSSGVPRSEAKEILAQSLLGLSRMLQDGHHPGVLREQISTPKGVTIRALETLEKGATRYVFGQAFKDAVPSNREDGH
jgi:pyrroline-5-carboxylate reductase